MTKHSIIALSAVLIASMLVAGCAMPYRSSATHPTHREVYLADRATESEIKTLIDAVDQSIGEQGDLSISNIYTVRRINGGAAEIGCGIVRAETWSEGEYKSVHLKSNAPVFLVGSSHYGACDPTKYTISPDLSYSGEFILASEERSSASPQQQPPTTNNSPSTATVSNDNIRTAHECNEAYGVGTPQGLGVDKVNDYLECIDIAKEEYGNRGESFEPIEPGSSIEVDVNYDYHPGEMKLSNGNIMRGKNWESLRQVLPTNQEQRDTIIDAFSRYWFEYDKFDNTLKVEPLRYISGPYSQTSYVSLRGQVTEGSAPRFRIEFKFYGSDWLFANRVRVHSDGSNWDSGPIDFTRDHTDKIWEIASLPLSGRGLEVANLIANGNDVTIRFGGTDYYHDFIVPDVMKEDLAAMLKAIEYL